MTFSPDIPRKRTPIFGTLAGWVDLPIPGGNADREVLPVGNGVPLSKSHIRTLPAEAVYTPAGSYSKVTRERLEKPCAECGQSFKQPKHARQKDLCQRCVTVARECVECGHINRIGRYEAQFICRACEAVNDVQLRGDVTTFSNNSRRNLMQQLNRVERDIYPLFVTLTFPDSYARRAEDSQDWKARLRRFEMRFLRAFPSASFIWRLETIDRKSGMYPGRVFPHFHLLAYGISLLKMKLFVFENWPEIACLDGENDVDYESCRFVHSPDRHGKKAVEKIKSRNGVMAYASKAVGRVMSCELGKDIQTKAGKVGRWWGIVNRAVFKTFLAEEIPLDITDAKAALVLNDFRSKIMAGLVKFREKLARDMYRKGVTPEKLAAFLAVSERVESMEHYIFQSLVMFISGDEFPALFN